MHIEASDYWTIQRGAEDKMGHLPTCHMRLPKPSSDADYYAYEFDGLDRHARRLRRLVDFYDFLVENHPSGYAGYSLSFILDVMCDDAEIGNEWRREFDDCWQS